MENLWQFWVLDRGNLNFCVRRTPLRGRIKYFLSITVSTVGRQLHFKYRPLADFNQLTTIPTHWRLGLIPGGCVYNFDDDYLKKQIHKVLPGTLPFLTLRLITSCSCSECSQGRYGKDCSEACGAGCSSTNTCNPVNGTCSCTDNFFFFFFFFFWERERSVSLLMTL